jgi:hypothetical protein
MSYALTAVSHMLKPSWCFEVITRYFMPAALARRANARASNAVGSN